MIYGIDHIVSTASHQLLPEDLCPWIHTCTIEYGTLSVIESL